MPRADPYALDTALLIEATPVSEGIVVPTHRPDMQRSTQQHGCCDDIDVVDCLLCYCCLQILCNDI
jgi:hypothetical protein